MDAELYQRTIRKICQEQKQMCSHLCPLCVDHFGCIVSLYSNCQINPVPIVEKYLKKHPEPKPLPGLPGKLQHADGNVEAMTLNAIIDYLAAREEGK